MLMKQMRKSSHQAPFHSLSLADVTYQKAINLSCMLVLSFKIQGSSCRLQFPCLVKSVYHMGSLFT